MFEFLIQHQPFPQLTRNLTDLINALEALRRKGVKQ